MTSWNGLHKLPVAFFGKTPKPLWIKVSKMVKWWTKTSKQILQPQKGLVLNSLPFFLFITNSIKSEVKSSEDSGLSSFQINYFLDISSYFPKLQYAHWVSISTPDPKFPGSSHIEVLAWSVGQNLITRLSVNFWSNKVKQSD